MHLSTPLSEILFYGAILTCVWGSLRWGDALQGAVVGVCIRKKTTKRSMPFAFLLSGLTGSASSSWATRYITVLRHSVSDSLALQLGRALNFLPSVMAGTGQRPTLSRPMPRDVAVPRLLQLIHAVWKSHEPSASLPSVNLYGSHSCKSTLLASGRQLNLSKALRRIQGHHRLSRAY